VTATVVKNNDMFSIISHSRNRDVNGTDSDTDTGTTGSSKNSKSRRRSIRLLVTVVGCFIPIVFFVIVQIRWEVLSFSSTSAIPRSTTPTIVVEDTVPHLIECVDKCLLISHPQGCYNSDGVPLRGDNRWANQWKQVTDNNTLSSLSLSNQSYDYNTNTNHSDGFISPDNQTRTIITGDIVVVLFIHTPERNINHIFHDDFWSILSYFSQPSTLQQMQHSTTGNNSVAAPVTVTLVHDYSSPWLTSLVEIIVQAYPWWNVARTSSYQTRWICTSLSQSQKLYVNGYIRDMHSYQLPELIRIRDDLRSVAYHQVTNDKIWTKILEDSNATVAETEATTTAKQELIVIYTREDTSTRNIHDAQKLIDALDTDRYRVHVQRYMPSNFYEQVAMFGMADLLIAPNGGWTPNVLWMKDTACLVEIHLYDTNSWLVQNGLASLFQPAHHVQVVTGDYHNSTVYGPRLQLPNRHGGDDEIQGSMVISDIVQQLQQSPDCQRFLRKSK
jgi:uncharacterized protein involved in tolerance to divalent cations